MQLSSIKRMEDYDHHYKVMSIDDPKKNLRAFIAIHRAGPTTRSFGATRIWAYSSEIDALKDSLQLSKAMSYKAALAELPYGGAKATIMATYTNLEQKKEILKAYAQYVNLLKGKFITGADVGITKSDVDLLREQSQYIVGTKVDPVKYTGMGIVAGIETSLKFVFGSESFQGKSVAIQGVGKVGTAVLERIYDQSEKIYISDVNSDRLKEVKKLYPKVKILSIDEIYGQTVDIFSPCALSHCLNSKVISQIKASIIAGGANNQLESVNIGEKLYKMGILYAPDYVINAGGLIAVVDEYESERLNDKRVTEKVMKIQGTLNSIFSKSKTMKKATNIIANAMAEEIISQYNQRYASP